MGRSGVLDETVPELEFEFDVSTPMFTYKATLAYTDEEGESNTALALKNDLDLTLISPSDEVYRPWNLIYPLGATIPAEPWGTYALFKDPDGNTFCIAQS